MQSSPRLRFVRALSCLLAFAASARAQGLRVQAGEDRFVLPPATQVRLQGSVGGVKVSEIPGDLTIAWAQLSGPPAVIVNKDTLSPTIVPSKAGILRLRLKVIEPRLGADTDEVLVHVFGADQDAEIAGEARKWHKLTLTFTHNATLSESSTINPFLDLRLVTHFYNVQSGVVQSVPGFFAADGNAGETGATAGTRWRVNFTPDHAGTWYYATSFRAGNAVLLDPGSDAGQPASFDGANGTFQVESADPAAPGFLSRGRLEYVGQHHLRFAETHEYFLKGGTDSPENFLAYYEFENTFDLGGAPNDLNSSGAFDGLHHYNAHLSDYVDLGVPVWQGGKGRRIFGALNYLAARGVNSLYALTYNIDGGDGSEVWPWSTPTNKLRFDVSKLDQWERVLDHMNRAGIVWHAVTQETENDHVLDGGALDVQRKLYYHQLVARFAYAPGLVWNLGEENDNTPDECMAFADYIHALDPFDHPVALHNRPADLVSTFGPLLGSHLEMVSLQGLPTLTPISVQELVEESAAAGRPWVVNFDEQNPANDGVVPDAVNFWHDLIRQEALWPTLLGQGGGCEWYFGYGHPNADLDCEDFRSRENLWLITRRALDFMQAHVPFEEMQDADHLAFANAPHVLTKPGELYVIYLQSGGPLLLDLEGHAGTFLVSWFDARNGGALQNGTVTQVDGPGVQDLGTLPAPGDWTVFVRRAANLAPIIESVAAEPDPFLGGEDFAIRVHARDPNGPTDALSASVAIRDPAGNLAVVLPLVHRGGSLYSLFLRDAPSVPPGTWQLSVTVQDAGGASATQSGTFRSL